MKQKIPSLETIVKNIKKQGFVQLEFPMERQEMESAASTFLDFLNLDLKRKFYALVHPSDRGSTIGYIERTGKTVVTKKGITHLDNKEYLHYNEYFDHYFEPYLKLPEVKPFVEQAKNIYNKAKDTIDNVLDRFEEEFPNIHDQFFSKETKPRFYLRFLKYDYSGRNQTLAKGHYDRGALTLALAESHPGLRIGKKGRQKEIVHEDGHAILFPGMAIDKAMRPGYLIPSWHDVVQKTDNALRPGVARWSIVFFADHINQPNFSYEDTHQPKNY